MRVSYFLFWLFSFGLLVQPAFCQHLESLGKNLELDEMARQFEDILANKENRFERRVWMYARFGEVPTQEQKSFLQQEGFLFHQYQPDLKWFVSMPEKMSASLLHTAGVKQLFTKPKVDKIDQRIQKNQIPSYAQDAMGYKATVIVGAGLDAESAVQVLEKEGLVIRSRFEPLGIYQVAGSRNDLISASQLPFVVYVELPEPPAELEIEDEMTMTRAPFINGYYNLDGLNGEGVKIAVNEGGIINPIYHPDFKNRMDLSQESGGVSGHKTTVSWRMSSAGNINPTHRGQAWGADHMSGGINFGNAADSNINIVNNSFGYGCIPVGPTYNAGAATNDFLVRTHNRFMITYSCGNIGGSTCNSYGAGPGWGNITGLVKSAKNIFAVGAMNTNDELTGFSSRGPAMDGRILPDITATGPGGTSHASPNLAGVNAILTQAYRNENANQWPNSGLIKGIILNTADDIENPGPDFKTGFGRINASRALAVIEDAQHLTDNVANGATDLNTISVPSGVKQLKVSIYWNDREATPGISGKTLVNDLDLRLQLPNLSWVKPWVLSSFPHPDSLNANAVHGTDTLNNVELVTIDNPQAGNYNVEVSGTLVPFGPQEYYVIYSFVYDSIEVIFPKGGEGLVPGEVRRIRWDAYDSGNTFDIDYSIDNGANWQSIVTGLASHLRTYTWSIPSTLSGECLVKVKTSAQEAISDTVFTIAEVPLNLHLVWRCADSAIFAWDTLSGVSGYRAYRLGQKFMDTLGFTTDNYIKIYNLSSSERDWVSVQSVLPDSGSGRRAIAMAIDTGDFNCIGEDLAVSELISPSAGYYPTCALNDTFDLKIKFQNTGTTNLFYLPFAYQINGGTIAFDTIFDTLSSAAQAFAHIPSALSPSTGVNLIKVWSTYPNDGNAANDTALIQVIGYAGTSATLPYTQNFDNFTNCSTAWGCQNITCSVSAGWYNIPNQVEGDSIDWRTHSGATGSGGTGPSGDHTSGSGKYLYLEGSGNGGSGCQNKEAFLISPCFDLEGTNQPTLSYWYHAFGGSIGSLHLDVQANGQWHLDVGPSVIGEQGNQWFQQTADLSDFEGEKVNFRFRGITGGGWQSDLAIDDINLSTFPLANFTTLYDTFCLGQAVPFLNNSTYGNAYQWSIAQSTYNFVSGGSSSVSPSIVPNDTGWYDVQLIVNGTTGSDTLLINHFFYVVDYSAPSVSSNGMDDTFCPGDSAVFTATGGASIYQFFYNNALVQSGSGFSWSNLNPSHGDSIWVVNEINPTCILSSEVLQIKVQPDLEGSPLQADDADLSICEGDTVRFNVPVSANAYDFMLNSLSVQAGADSLYTTDQLTDGDVVKAKISDSIGCSFQSDSLQWMVYAVPPKPEIAWIAGDSIQSTVIADQYRWWLDAILLPDTTRSILAQSSGAYALQVFNTFCESDLSDELPYTLGQSAAFHTNEVTIYPNPARETLNVICETDDFELVSLYDKTGQLVFYSPVHEGLNTLSIRKLPSGVYSVHLHGRKSNFKVQKVIIQ